jgi:hypothetical protein
MPFEKPWWFSGHRSGFGERARVLRVVAIAMDIRRRLGPSPNSAMISSVPVDAGLVLLAHEVVTLSRSGRLCVFGKNIQRLARTRGMEKRYRGAGLAFAKCVSSLRILLPSPPVGGRVRPPNNDRKPGSDITLGRVLVLVGRSGTLTVPTYDGLQMRGRPEHRFR